MSQQIDETDLEILKHLQEDGRSQRNHLAELVGLSVPSVSDRMRKLEERGVIEGYTAILNAKAFQLDITAFIFVEVDGSNRYADFVRHVADEAEVMECHSITGDGSHVLKIRTRNTESFERLLSRIQSWDGVKRTRSNVVLSTFKETRRIPVDVGF
jgi:Lrp/AsnC family leucine-responsive transcriptional regulator